MYMEIRHLHHTYAYDEIFFAQMKKATNSLVSGEKFSDKGLIIKHQ